MLHSLLDLVRCLVRRDCDLNDFEHLGHLKGPGVPSWERIWSVVWFQDSLRRMEIINDVHSQLCLSVKPFDSHPGTGQKNIAAFFCLCMAAFVIAGDPTGRLPIEWFLLECEV